jgi:M6 family metalloprotease-like protein
MMIPPRILTPLLFRLLFCCLIIHLTNHSSADAAMLRRSKRQQRQGKQNSSGSSTSNRIRGVKKPQEQKHHRALQVDSSGPILNVLVCLMQWTNHPTRNTSVPREDYEQLFNGQGRSARLFPGGTVGDYFKSMSFGEFQINFQVTDWIMTDYTEQEFTKDGSQGRTQELQKAFEPVLQYLDNDFYDFSSLDADFDRKIDLTIFLHSGYEGVIGGDDCETGATSTQRIASHARAGADESTWISAGGYKLGPYAVAPAFRGICDIEICRIGSIIHETIHTFGLPEMYDTERDYGTGNIGGIDRYVILQKNQFHSLLVLLFSYVILCPCKHHTRSHPSF